MGQYFMDVFDIKTSVQAIRSRLAPGRVVHCERNTGKTTALLEWVHDVLPEKGVRSVGFITHDWNSARRLEVEYERRWPEPRDGFNENSISVKFVPGHEITRLLGFASEVVVDEWWKLREEDQRALRLNWEVLAAVGTLEELMSVPI